MKERVTGEEHSGDFKDIYDILLCWIVGTGVFIWSFFIFYIMCVCV